MGGVFGHACAGADDDGEDAESTRCGAPCLCCHGGPEEHEDEPDTDEECSSPEQGLRGCGAAPAGVVWAPVPGTPPTFGVVPAVQVARQDSLASLSSSATAFPNAAHLSRVADLAQCPPPPLLGTGPLRGGGCSCSSSATVRTLPPCWEQPEAAGAPAPAAAAVTPLSRRYGTDSRDEDEAGLQTRQRRQSAPPAARGPVGEPRRRRGTEPGVALSVATDGDLPGAVGAVDGGSEEMVTPRAPATTARLLCGTPEWGDAAPDCGASKAGEARGLEKRAQGLGTAIVTQARASF